MGGHNKVISKESLSAYERWELPHVEGPGGPAEEEVPSEETPQPLTAEQIEAIQREARDEAYKEGFEQGRKEGLQSGQAEIRASVERLEQVFRALGEPLADVDAQVEEELLELALAVARQVVRRELKTDPGQIVAVVREALGVLPSLAREIRVFLHPDDAVLVREALSVPEGEERHWRIVEEPVLTRGGCRVESDNSYIDASLEKQLATVTATLLGGERRDDELASD